MEWLQQLITKLTEGFKWFFILQPWEQGLRVRAGRWIKKFDGGIHFRVPYIDSIYKQNTRLRIADMGNQTITTRDGKTISMSSTLRYRVKDILPLYEQLHMAEDTILQMVQAMVTDYIAARDISECNPKKLHEFVNAALNLEQYGLDEAHYAVIDFVNVRTYRLINGDFYSYSDHKLSTDKPDE